MLSTFVVRHVKLSNRIAGFVLLFKIFGTAVFTNIKYLIKVNNSNQELIF